MAKPAAQPHIASAYTYAELGDGRAQHAALAEECALAISYNDCLLYTSPSPRDRG